MGDQTNPLQSDKIQVSLTLRYIRGIEGSWILRTESVVREVLLF